ncbi:flagellar assembly peptidoglycan hydrolase FlgJ [uncultured Shewanella sp.]|uniref:flagellar assembly peptidoglycan hydrolase FlgJ n=1 Tax=uncultured Shewanella sp. TaxID=173975 RepID=UPI002611EBAF|nr:flagellar assembly peptidoglycan hydrolase FlgJ [uncultured Shewanella sp.]
MDKFADASQFLNLNGFAALRSKSQKEDPEALKQVAQQFEGIFVQMLMKSMRDANKVFEADSPLNSQYTQFYEQMHDQQMSLNLSRDGMLGLSDLMVQQLSPETSQILPASVLRADNNTPNFMPKAPTEIDVDQGGQRPLASNLFDKLAIGDEGATLNQCNLAIDNHQSIPNDSVDLNISSPAAFVAKLYPYAVEAAKRLGTQAEVLLAQSALETGWGQKVIQTQAGNTSHNLFNIKAGLSWQGQTAVVDTLEFEQGRQIKQSASFRVYDDIKHSFDDFVDLLTREERYQAVIQNASTPKSFIQGLQDAGYATDPQYTYKVMRVLKSITQDLLPRAVLR